MMGRLRSRFQINDRRKVRMRLFDEKTFCERRSETIVAWEDQIGRAGKRCFVLLLRGVNLVPWFYSFGSHEQIWFFRSNREIAASKLLVGFYVYLY